MKVSNSTYFTNISYPKIIELNDNTMAINGLLHDKQTLTPIAFSDFKIGELSNIATKSRMSLNNTHQRSIIKNNYMVDIEDENIFYVVIDNSSAGRPSPVIYKYTQNNNVLKLLDKYVAPIFSLDILQQTKDYLICGHSKYYYNGMVAYCNDIKIIEKENMTLFSHFTYGSDSSQNYVNILKLEGKSSLYLSQTPRQVVNRNRNIADLQIYKFQLDSGGSKLLYTEKTSVSGVFCKPVEVNEWYYCLICQQEGSDDVLKMRRFKINIDDTITIESFPIELTDDWNFVLEKNPSTAIFELNTFTKLNNTYIVLSIYSNGAYNEYSNSHKNIVFRLDSNKLIIVDFIKFDVSCKGVLTYRGPETLLFVSNDWFRVYKFDSTIEKYTLVFLKTISAKNIGVDSLDRIYIEQENGIVEMIPTLYPVILSAYFTKKNYNYNEVSMVTSVCYYCKNHLDEFISKNVKLNLLGNAVFQENNSRNITKTTSSSYVLNIPVVITGDGAVEVIITPNI